nr:uncharacterized mitochondrial protein AtMg00810-like [Tanacetum cinerariifolium]
MRLRLNLTCSTDTDGNSVLYSDHAGCLDSRKSRSGGIQFLGGDKLVRWSSKKQDYYGFHFDKIPMYCDSKAAIAISCNLIQHSRTKHIGVRYHFIKEKVKKGIVELFFVGTEYQLADLFTKALPEERFKYLVRRLDTIHMGLWYPKDIGFELTDFLDSNHAGCLDSRKSTSGGIQFLSGDKLVNWSSKKHDCTSMSSAEAEYVSLSACCAQILWMRTQLTDYGFHFDKIATYCDSKAAIAISYNPVQHSRTKHIDVRYHFIKEKVEKDLDHASCLDSCKSTSGGIQFLGGDKLVSWSSKKQDCTSISFAEAEYVSLAVCCAQVLWMRT